MADWVIALLVLLPLFTLVIGFFVGFYISQKMLKKQLKQNPLITEAQIKTMYAQMGRKPSEKQIRAIMNNINRKTK